MLKLRVVQARYGDCSILENGPANDSSGRRRKHILIDGGPSKVYGPYLRGELEAIAERGGKLDLLVLSHIDNDHVRGLLELMRDLREARADGKAPLIDVEQIWHNGFSKILPPELEATAAELERETALEVHPDPDMSLAERAAEAYGIAEGHELQEADVELGIPRNQGFAEGLITVENTAQPIKVAGVKLWVIGPTGENLAKLREKWVSWLMRKSLPYGPGEEKPVRPDEAVNNLSSIMLMAEAGSGRSRRRILLTGDGVTSDITGGLEAAGLLEKDGVLRVDVLKVPHHGSARNSVGGLYERVLADTYVISGDGRYANPDETTLNWIVDAACRQQRQIEIFATNMAPALKALLRERPPEENNYRLRVLPVGQSSDLI